MQSMILRLYAAPSDARRNRGIVKNGREIESARLPVVHRWLHIEHVDAADHLVHGAESHLRHVFADLLGNKEKEINHVLRLTLKLFPQQRVLCGNAYRAG